MTIRGWRVMVQCPMGHKLGATLRDVIAHDEGLHRMTCPMCDSEIEKAALDLEMELGDNAESEQA